MIIANGISHIKKRVGIICLICIFAFTFIACSKVEINPVKIIDCLRKPMSEREGIKTEGVTDLTLINPLPDDLASIMNKQQEFETLVIYANVSVIDEEILNYFLKKVTNLIIESNMIFFSLEAGAIPMEGKLQTVKLASNTIDKFNDVVFNKNLLKLEVNAPIDFDISEYAYLEKLDNLILKRANITNLENALFPNTITELVLEDCILDQGKAFLQMKNIKTMAFRNTNIMDFIKETDLAFVKSLVITP